MNTQIQTLSSFHSRLGQTQDVCNQHRLLDTFMLHLGRVLKTTIYNCLCYVSIIHVHVKSNIARHAWILMSTHTRRHSRWRPIRAHASPTGMLCRLLERITSSRPWLNPLSNVMLCKPLGRIKLSRLFANQAWKPGPSRQDRLHALHMAVLGGHEQRQKPLSIGLQLQPGRASKSNQANRPGCSRAAEHDVDEQAESALQMLNASHDLQSFRQALEFITVRQSR